MFRYHLRAWAAAVCLLTAAVSTEARAAFSFRTPPPPGAVSPEPPIVDPPVVIPPPPVVIVPPYCPPPVPPMCATPEPATMTLAAIGLIGAVGANRLRRKK